MEGARGEGFRGSVSKKQSSGGGLLHDMKMRIPACSNSLGKAEEVGGGGRSDCIPIIALHIKRARLTGLTDRLLLQ